MTTAREESATTKAVTIIVNGRPRIVEKGEISFSEVVALAFDSPPYGANTLFTVTYRHGHSDKPKGTLVDGQSVKVKEGMVFDVSATDKS